LSARRKGKRLNRNLYRLAVAEWVEYLLTADAEEIAEIAKDPKSPAYQRLTAKALFEGMRDGNLGVLGWFLDRAHGKPAQQLTIDAEVNHKIEEYKSMTTKQLIATFEDNVRKLGDGNESAGGEQKKASKNKVRGRSKPKI